MSGGSREGEAPGLAARLCSAAAITATVVAWTGWALRVLPSRSGPSLEAVRAIDGLGPLPGAGLAIAAVAALSLLACLRHPALASGRTAGAVSVLALGSICASLASPHGHLALIAVAALFLSVLLGAHGPPRAALERPGPRDRAVAGALWAMVAATHAAYSIHRHLWFGSGSWDHGCMVHNFFRASRFLDTTSTVLGDVDFLGDHFMPGIYLLAPLTWVFRGTWSVLALQAVSLAATAPVIFLVARGRGAGRGPAAALALVGALSFGMQSAAYFDSHEITVGFGFFAWGVWALERRRLGLATALLLVFALFKESLGAYLAALGLLLAWRGLRDRDRAARWTGLAWIGLGVAWFLLVNRVFMPALIARASPPEPHETFADFGPTVLAAAEGILRDPVKALGALFVPAAKVSSLLVTLGGLGFVSLLAPELLLAAAPLLAERFLSSKSTMWEMGYHYAASLAFVAAWGAAIAWPRAEALVARALGSLSPGLGARAPAVLAVHVAVAGLLVAGVGYRHPSNYFRWREGYFSTPVRREANAAAVALVDAQGRGARVAAQNRLLPHLADRPHIWRLGEWEKADLVVLSVGESAWPLDDAFPARLARRLDADPTWRLVFARDGAAVFARVGTSDLPEVPPTPPLGLGRGGLRGAPAGGDPVPAGAPAPGEENGP